MAITRISVEKILAPYFVLEKNAFFIKENQVEAATTAITNKYMNVYAKVEPLRPVGKRFIVGNLTKRGAKTPVFTAYIKQND